MCTYSVVATLKCRMCTGGWVVTTSDHCREKGIKNMMKGLSYFPSCL